MREMGILSNRVEKSEIKAGDHLYTWRAVYTYSHHGELSIPFFLIVLSITLSTNFGVVVFRVIRTISDGQCSTSLSFAVMFCFGFSMLSLIELFLITELIDNA